jgi:hypothetical protein
MRKGKNIVKDIILQLNKSNHRVIIPLHIPNEEGYYKDAFQIFVYCLSSLRVTSFSNLKISIISNGSCEEVNRNLFRMYEKEDFDELIIESNPIGKINSILKALRSAEERYITITDADILFMNGWERSVFDIFESFPKAAAVSPLPVFRTQNHYTSNIIFDYFFSKKMQFSVVKSPEALTRFANSIGWPWLDNKWKDVIMTIKGNNGIKAVVGCNHCVVTYKKEIFEAMPKGNSEFVLGGNSEALYLDRLNQLYDGYRLTTYNNFAYHLGNQIEDWMVPTFESLKKEQKLDYKIESKLLKRRQVHYFLKSIVFKKIMNVKYIRSNFYLWKGLDKTKLKNFNS